MTSRRGFSVITHRWLGLVLTVFVVMVALSGIVLNHREAFSRLQVSRSWLPGTFRYVHWNNAAIRAVLDVGEDGFLLYGGVGVWRASPDFSNLRECNRGFPAGADRRHIECVFRTGEGEVLAGTRYGLYRLDQIADMWHHVPLPTDDVHVVDMAQKGDQLYILTRSQILSCPASQLADLRPLALRPPPGWDGKIALFRVVWQLHSGELLGVPGKLLVDCLALVFMLLACTGVCLFIGPRWIRRRKRAGKQAKAMVSVVRWGRRWHRRLGIYSVVLLLTCTLLGMFLRPPLLLAVVRQRVKAWPGTALHQVGPWHDRLRRLHYDVTRDCFVLSTADGFFLFRGSMTAVPQRPATEPPVSVMGVKVLHQHAPGQYLVGSFMGLYLWCPERDMVLNWITRKPPPETRSRLPFGPHMVSGYVQDREGREFVFDYQHGAMPLGHMGMFPAMPDAARTSPMSMWHLALETHTGRIYSFFPWWFQLLWVAVFGVAICVVLITGVSWWWRVARRPRTPCGRTADVPPSSSGEGLCPDVQGCQGDRSELQNGIPASSV